MEAAVIYTVFALLGIGACVYFATIAQRSAARAEHSEKRLLNLRGRVVACEHAIEALDRTHRKFAGAFYRERRVDEPPQHVEEHEPVSNGDTVCPNYARAQLEGPFSAAAGCVCEYCEQRRSEREEFRRAARQRAKVTPVKGAGSE